MNSMDRTSYHRSWNSGAPSQEFMSILWSLRWRVKPVKQVLCIIYVAVYPSESRQWLEWPNRKLDCVVWSRQWLDWPTRKLHLVFSFMCYYVNVPCKKPQLVKAHAVGLRQISPGLITQPRVTKYPIEDQMSPNIYDNFGLHTELSENWWLRILFNQSQLFSKRVHNLCSKAC